MGQLYLVPGPGAPVEEHHEFPHSRTQIKLFGKPG